MISPRYPRDTPKIHPKYTQDTPKINPRYPPDIPKIFLGYPQDITKITPKIWSGLVWPLLKSLEQFEFRAI